MAHVALHGNLPQPRPGGFPKEQRAPGPSGPSPDAATLQEQLWLQ